MVSLDPPNIFGVGMCLVFHGKRVSMLQKIFISLFVRTIRPPTPPPPHMFAVMCLLHYHKKADQKHKKCDKRKQILTIRHTTNSPQHDTRYMGTAFAWRNYPHLLFKTHTQKMHITQRYPPLSPQKASESTILSILSILCKKSRRTVLQRC